MKKILNIFVIMLFCLSSAFAMKSSSTTLSTTTPTTSSKAEPFGFLFDDSIIKSSDRSVVSLFNDCLRQDQTLLNVHKKDEYYLKTHNLEALIQNISVLRGLFVALDSDITKLESEEFMRGLYQNLVFYIYHMYEPQKIIKQAPATFRFLNKGPVIVLNNVLIACEKCYKKYKMNSFEKIFEQLKQGFGYGSDFSGLKNADVLRFTIACCCDCDGNALLMLTKKFRDVTFNDKK
jgi:hypothetical protein